MASLSHERKTGRRTIQFTGRDGLRKTVRLGKVDKRQATAGALGINRTTLYKKMKRYGIQDGGQG
ncbi:MAG: hypothetical protein NTU94_13060 [Planctomycetota bacterium]|nr:hypothetical protein [Planctomycetota bacterium]